MTELRKVTLIAIMLLSLFVVGVVCGMSFYRKGMTYGILEFTNEVQIINIELIDEAEINLTLYSEVIDKEFTVSIYLDNSHVISFTTVWSKPKQAEFTIAGLDLSGVTAIKVEVTRRI